MRLLRYFVIFLALIGLGLWGLYSQRIAVIESLLQDRLAKIGYTGSELKFKTISSETIAVSSFHTAFPDGPLLQLYVTGLSLQFDAREILHGSINKLHIDSLQLVLAPQRKSSAKNAPPPFAKIRQYLPKEISIDSISITGPDIPSDLHCKLKISNAATEPLALKITFDSEQVNLPQLQIKKLRGTVLLHTSDAKKIIVRDGSSIQFDALSNTTTTVSNGSLSFSGIISKETTNGGWQLSASPVKILTEAITHKGASLSFSPINLEIQAQTHPLSAHVTLQNETLTLQQSQQQFIVNNLQAVLQAKESDIDLQIQFKPEIAPGVVQTHIIHNLATGNGTALIKTVKPFTLENMSSSLQDLLNTLNLSLQMESGLISAKAEIEWSDKKLQQILASFNLRKGIGSYGKTSFDGLLIQQSLQLFPTIKTRSSGYISATSIHNGVTLKQFSLQNQLVADESSQFPKLLIESIQTEIFNGIISSKHILFDPLHPDFKAKINLNRIDLKEVLKLIKVKGLSVSGILDGAITLQVKDKTVIVPEGELHSRAPGGTINYFPPGGREHLSSLPSYALQALEEFNYDILKATPSYYEDGTLIIAIHTEGHSPPLKTERPVHLNLNMEQNILSLLESLRYSSTLTDQLEQQLQAHP